jgi:polysaccharide biosynthesis protein PslH
MNILFVSAILPYPLYSGGQVRIYNLLKRLSKKHSITLLSYIRSDSERQYVKQLNFLDKIKLVNRGKAFQFKYLVRAFGVNPTKIDRYPLLLETYNSEEMHDYIESELCDHAYDFVHIEPFYVCPALPPLSIPLVISEHNIEYEVYDAYAKTYPALVLRPLMIRDAKRIRFWEEKIWSTASSVIAVSDSDAKKITSIRKKKTPIVPNGVDLDIFRFIQRKFSSSNPTFLFVGNFAWAPNQGAVATLLHKIWPSVIQKFPQARLTIVGKQFPEALRTSLSSGVSVKSNVEDIVKEYAVHDILLAPMNIAGGSKYKILEAMASGTVVITSKAGIQGIDGVPNTHFLNAETTEDFLKAITTIYTNPDKANSITTNARKLIEEKYNWDILADELDSVWRNVK